MLLFVYKLGIPFVNRFFSYTNRISYEWYLVHILVFGVAKFLLSGSLPSYIEIIICLVASYFMAYIYDRVLRLLSIK